MNRINMICSLHPIAELSTIFISYLIDEYLNNYRITCYIRSTTFSPIVKNAY